MRNELIAIVQGDEKFYLPADEITIPDVRYVGVMLDQKSQELIEFAYHETRKIHRAILEDRHRNKRLEIDIPDMSQELKFLREHERNEVVQLFELFRSLVLHILPTAEAKTYTYDNKTIAGVKYIGRS